MAISELKIKSEDRELLKKIQNGDRDAILQGLAHSGAFYRINAAVSAGKYFVREPVIGIYLKRLKEDKIIMDGYRVADFAYAALDILEIEKYMGNDIRVRRLINSRFNF